MYFVCWTSNGILCFVNAFSKDIFQDNIPTLSFAFCYGTLFSMWRYGFGNSDPLIINIIIKIFFKKKKKKKKKKKDILCRICACKTVTHCTAYKRWLEQSSFWSAHITDWFIVQTNPISKLIEVYLEAKR